MSCLRPTRYKTLSSIPASSIHSRKAFIPSNITAKYDTLLGVLRVCVVWFKVELVKVRLNGVSIQVLRLKFMFVVRICAEVHG